jgi:hypothetical protein
MCEGCSAVQDSGELAYYRMKGGVSIGIAACDEHTKIAFLSLMRVQRSEEGLPKAADYRAAITRLKVRRPLLKDKVGADGLIATEKIV